jgi:catechol 2,3-dioxygenase-like lactoylglutathione lyase family enzyme
VEQRLSLVTLGVSDLGRAEAFYTALGWERGNDDDEVVFFQCGGLVVALWDRASLGEDSAVEDNGGWGGVTLALNVRSPDEVDEVLAAAPLAFSYLRQVSAAVADAYLEEREALSVEERDARHALLEAVLDGRPIEGAATRAGVRLAPRLVVLAIALGESPDEVQPGVSRAVAARRKQRRIEEHLAAAPSSNGHGTTHALLGPGGGTVLVPADDVAGVDLEQVVAGIAASGSCDVWAGAAWAPSHTSVPSALAEARQVLRLAREGGRPPGGYRLVDVLLDHLVSQPEAAASLLGILQPLEAGSDLLETLEAWFAHDFDRRATAATLVIHPNTLDYRLRRIAELTALDLRTAEAIQLLGAALLARRQAPAPG